jgi:polyhydroxyalkanoate synthesis regulator phasin
MTTEEITEHLRKIAKAGVIAALRHLAPRLQPIVDDYNKGKIGLAEARELVFEVFAANESRIDLIVQTQRRMAQSLGQLAAQTPGQIERYPAWRLVRGGSRKIPRADWAQRWAAAGNATLWQGACKDDFVALKDAPIWAALGKGAGGYRDAIGNPFPPFAFGSGMSWARVSKEEAAELGLINNG